MEVNPLSTPTCTSVETCTQEKNNGLLTHASTVQQLQETHGPG